MRTREEDLWERIAETVHALRWVDGRLAMSRDLFVRDVRWMAISDGPCMVPETAASVELRAREEEAAAAVARFIEAAGRRRRELTEVYDRLEAEREALKGAA